MVRLHHFETEEMLDGYLDGRMDSRIDYPEKSNRSAAYRHGWLNGRDDRTNKPRATAQELSAEADRLLGGQL